MKDKSKAEDKAIKTPDETKAQGGSFGGGNADDAAREVKQDESEQSG